MPDAFTLYKSDRVHTNSKGGRIFARELLKVLDVPFCEDIRISKSNRERLEADSFYKTLMYADHIILGNYMERNSLSELTEEQKINRLKEVANTVSGYIGTCAKTYLEHFGELIDAKNTVIEKTCKAVAEHSKISF